ncbi:response regulator transcription factor [Guptibacillus hwajinpoensis]|uniref:Two-component system alkaline phosphatase synthesis response regulator PhoP n=1 Tax=Guptibacillus hwajinpoensis TaxID=208199 RepID=A0ABU0JYV9_9BACL|nr:response regulator transcription factor [Alkalihalobacillus hemicentroti]MDQ0481328.1 two-component system alkaline phosphatase synthesis response regulator PhoP [Alkalihalobacillus hemicentroti]
MSQKILVVDDELSILTLLQFNLEQAGYEVVTAENGAEALEVVTAENPKCIILDLMLPEMDGLEVCKELRQRHIHTPVLMLTAKDDEFDKVLGLELGADDYMTKPFSPREVVARVKAILRRVKQLEESKTASEMQEEEKIQVGQLAVYPNNYEAFFQGKIMEVTPKEFELLVYLVRHKGRVLTREQLLSAVWDYDFVGDTRIVDVHVSHLREKIEQNTRKPEYIKTIRGLGYKLEEPSM